MLVHGNYSEKGARTLQEKLSQELKPGDNIATAERHQSLSLATGCVDPGSRGSRYRILFLAHSFPPLRAIPCVRTWNIAKHLARRGWEVSVLTPDPSLWKCVDDPQEFEMRLNQENIRRITTSHNWRCLMPEQLRYRNSGLGWVWGGMCRHFQIHMGIDRAIGWLKPAKQASNRFGKGTFDVVLATGGPFITFRLAEWLAEKIQCPYVLDYRDPWADNPYLPTSLLQHSAGEEARLLEGASAVTVVSPSWANALTKRYGIHTKVSVMTNGYDLEELAQVQPHQFDHRAIVYTGTFYLPKRALTPVMAALQVLAKTVDSAKTPWLFHYYGSHDQYVRAEASRFGVEDYVVIHGNVPRRDVLSAVRGASVAAVIASVADQVQFDEQGMIPGKLYEAIGLRTPVLLIAGTNSDARVILNQVGVGEAFMGKETCAIAKFLKRMLADTQKQPTLPDEFSWNHISGTLDEVLCTLLQEQRV